jgi:hypothetical protein
MGLESMLQTYIKCSNAVEHDQIICPKHYEGLSKGMEAAGSARIMNHLFETRKVVIGKLVGNDDSSSSIVMRHSFEELIDAGKMTFGKWPR